MDAFDRSTAITQDEIDYLDNLAPVAAMARRSLRLNRLLENGSATVMEFLMADFGTATPKGLDLKPVENFTIPIVTFAAKDNPRVGGRALPTGEITISSNAQARRDPQTKKLDVNHGGAFLASHEFLHRLQYHDLNHFGDSQPFRHSFVKPALSLPFPTTLKDLGHALMVSFKRACVGYEQADRTDKPAIKLKQLFGLNSLSVGHYLAKDYELQARMHEVLLAGYTNWGKMPATKIELYAALHGAGAVLPGEALYALRATEEGRKAAKDFQLNASTKTLIARTIQDINDVTAYAVTDDAKNKLWNFAIPALYGNMIEMYGDTLGRERMGMGPNRREILNVARILRDPEPDEAALQKALDQVSPENAAELVSHLCYNARHQKANTLMNTQIIDTLLNKPACRDALISTAGYDTYGKTSEWTPLETALRSGSMAIAHKLMVAGADPFDPVERYNDVTGLRTKASAFGAFEDLPYLKQKFGKDSVQYQALLYSLESLNEIFSDTKGDKKFTCWVSGRSKPEEISINDIIRRAGRTPGHPVFTDFTQNQPKPALPAST
jgi:hypothetical protein